MLKKAKTKKASKYALTIDRSFKKEMKRNWSLYLMCGPGLLWMILFNFIPMPGLWMAFTEYNVVDGIFGSRFVGLNKFKYFFTTPSGQGMQSVYNTLYLNAWGLVLGLVIPVAIAIFFNEIHSKAFKKVTQSFMFFPYFLSWVVVSALIYGLFASDTGLINGVLRMLGKDPVRWYADPTYWKPIMIVANVWKWCGYSSITYMAAMTNFDGSLYEAAKVDGANKFQQIMYLTIPMLKPTMVVLTLMSVGRIFFGDFGMVYAIIGNNPVMSDELAVIDTYVYGSMKSLGFSYATAIGLLQSILGLILVSLSNKLAKKINDGEGLF